MSQFAKDFNPIRQCPYSKRGNSENRNQTILEYLLNYWSNRIVAYKTGYELYERVSKGEFKKRRVSTPETWIRYDATAMDFTSDVSIMYWLDFGKIEIVCADNTDTVIIIHPEPFNA
jgi:hypothetical protein